MQFEVWQQGCVKEIETWATVKCYLCSSDLFLFPTGAFFRINLLLWSKSGAPTYHTVIFMGLVLQPGSVLVSLAYSLNKLSFFYFLMLMTYQFFLQESMMCIPLKRAQASLPANPSANICTCQGIISLQKRALRKEAYSETQTDCSELLPETLYDALQRRLCNSHVYSAVSSIFWKFQPPLKAHYSLASKLKNMQTFCFLISISLI